jgi:uncharacterized membrane protein YphA (DoxX/SURF4 family)
MRDPNWASGDEIRRYLGRATSVPAAPARPPITFGWYRRLLTRMMDGDRPRLLAQLIVLGQMASGLGLLLPIQPRVAAAIGLLQNLMFAMAGSSGHNPTMMLAQQQLIVASDDVGRLGILSGRSRRELSSR